MMNAFCASVNFDAFIRFHSSPSQENVAENFSFKWSSLRRAEQSDPTPTTVRQEWLDQYIIENIEEAQDFATQWLWI